MLPGGPARDALGAKAAATAIATFNRDNGLDKPIYVQFAVYLGRVVQKNSASPTIRTSRWPN
jgi:peptide/nickel transport system permease protein